jgi:cell wall-associated NlpC family hydrolase
MAEGETAEVVSEGIWGDGLQWHQISYYGTVGYAAADYLSVSSSGGGGPGPDPSPGGGIALGAWATVSGTGGDGVNVRSGPGTENAVLTGAPEGTDVWVIDGPSVDWSGGAWYMIEVWGVTGWVYGTYLASAGTGGGEPNPVLPEIPPTDEVGAAIVTEAYKWMGVPYLWAGTTPAGFDCSGFTYYVLNEVLERNFPRAIYRQIRQGDFVPADELLPGDLVFFENTYTTGLSHVGIYIGYGQFINAGGGVDAVGIDYVFDGYWGERYMGARRVR